MPPHLLVSPTSNSTLTRYSPTSSTPTSGCSSSPPTPAGSPRSSPQQARSRPRRQRMRTLRTRLSFPKRGSTSAGWSVGASRPSMSVLGHDSISSTASLALWNTSATGSWPALTTSRCASTSPALTTPTATCTAHCCASPTDSSSCSSPRTEASCTPMMSPPAPASATPSTSLPHGCDNWLFDMWEAVTPTCGTPIRSSPTPSPTTGCRLWGLAAWAPRYSVVNTWASSTAPGSLTMPSWLRSKRCRNIDDPLTGTPRPVDYQNLDSEEFGGMYEGLLGLQPPLRPGRPHLHFTVAAGNDRKKSGSYYTPSELIDVVLNEALDPLIAEALGAKTPQERERRFSSLAVVDPACGKWAFRCRRQPVGSLLLLLRCERRYRTESCGGPRGDRRVIERCMYGVDLNDLAIEITKVASWLEAFDAGRPFPFLDAHFRVGNALLGTTPALLKQNIPDAAFVALGDDDKDWTSKLKARNKAERQADADQFALDFGSETLDMSTTEFHAAAQTLTADDRAICSRYALGLMHGGDLKTTLSFEQEARRRRWCAAFVQPKRGHDITSQGITYGTLAGAGSETPRRSQIVSGSHPRHCPSISILSLALASFLASSPSDDTQGYPRLGWSGGFSCVIGNPPWERVKLQDKEFFGKPTAATDIEKAKTAAIRKKMIDDLAETDPDFLPRLPRRLATIRCDRTFPVEERPIPLTGQGDVNTYSVFAETMRTIAARQLALLAAHRPDSPPTRPQRPSSLTH